MRECDGFVAFPQGLTPLQTRHAAATSAHTSTSHDRTLALADALSEMATWDAERTR